MALDVRLVDNVQAQLVRHLVEIGVIGIVRGANGIEIKLFHQSQVLEDFIEAIGLSTCGTVVVSIHSLNQYGLAVDQKLSVGDFDVAESDGAIVHIYCGSSSRASPDQNRTESIQFRVLVRPGEDVSRHLHLERNQIGTEMRVRDRFVTLACWIDRLVEERLPLRTVVLRTAVQLKDHSIGGIIIVRSSASDLLVVVDVVSVEHSFHNVGLLLVEFDLLLLE